MDYFIGKQFHHRDEPEFLYLIYKEDPDKSNTVWINWAADKIGLDYLKSQVQAYLEDRTWVESIEPFKIEIE